MDNFNTVEINISLGKMCDFEILKKKKKKKEYSWNCMKNCKKKKKKRLDIIQSSPTSDLYRKIKNLWVAHV